MSSMNNVSVIGRLTNDPDLRYTQGGKAVSTFGLAMNEKYKSGDEWKTKVCFVEITVWDKSAEASAEYLQKGHLCGVVGALTYDTWENEAGEKKSKLFVTAKNVIFLEKKPNEE
jgi:single-strand DNA-binding protein